MINSLASTLYFAALDGTKSLKLSEDHIEFWQKTRQYVVGGDTLGSSDLVVKTIQGPVQVILGVAIVAIAVSMLYNLGFKSGKNGAMPVVLIVLPQFIWLCIVLLFLNNNFEKAYEIANWTWDFRNNLRDNTGSVIQANQTFTEAISNELFHAQFGQQVASDLQTCQDLPFPTVRVPTAVRTVGAEGASNMVEENQTYDFLSCLTTLEDTIERNQKALEEQCGQNLVGCEVVKQKATDVGKQVSDANEKIRRRLVLDAPGSGLGGLSRIPDPLAVTSDFSAVGDAIAGALSSVGKFAYMKLVELGNTLYTGSIEIMFLLAGLFFPITIAWALIPGRRKILLDWGAGILALVITEQIYLILVGTVAVMSGLPQFHAIGPGLFLATLGIIAPLIAIGSGGVSGLAMGKSYRGSVGAGAAAGVSIAGGAALSIAYKMNARRQLKR